LVAFDGLHPSGKMYSEWVKKILDQAELRVSKEEDIVDEASDEDEDDNEDDGGE
jgi:hypothetical protein